MRNVQNMPSSANVQDLRGQPYQPQWMPQGPLWPLIPYKPTSSLSPQMQWMNNIQPPPGSPMMREPAPPFPSPFPGSLSAYWNQGGR